MACDDLVHAFEEQQLECGFDPEQQVLRRGAAELVVAELRLAALPVPVKTRRGIRGGDLARLLVDGDESHPGRRHEAFLRSADSHVDAQLIHGERRGGQRRHDIDHEKRRMAGGIDRRAQAAQVVGGAACGIGVHRKDRLDFALRVGTQGLFDIVRVDRIALAERRADNAAAGGLGLDRPGLRKCPVPGMSTVCPGAIRFSIVASHAPWPLEANMKISPLVVWSTFLMPVSIASMVSPRRGSPWSSGWRCMALSTSAGTWVGPGEWRERLPGMRIMVRRGG